MKFIGRVEFSGCDMDARETEEMSFSDAGEWLNNAIGYFECERQFSHPKWTKVLIGVFAVDEFTLVQSKIIRADSALSADDLMALANLN